MCDLVFATIFDQQFIVRKADGDSIIKELMSSCKVTVIIGRYSLKFNFHNRFLTNSQEIIFKKYFHWEPSCSMLKNGPMS